MKKLFLSSIVAFLFFAWPAKAVCPVCTIAVGAGVGLARYLGVDDTISGVWIGGLIMSVSFWTINWLRGKNKKFTGDVIIVIAAYYVLTILPLYWKNIIGHPFNKVCGMDKLVFGILWGSVGFVVGTFLNGWLKKRNGGKVYFPFQKVVFGISPLIILSIIFYFCW